MKKTLITLMMSLLVVVAISQSPVTLKAHTYNFGIKNEIGVGNADDIVWIGEQPSEILILLGSEDVVIYSEKKQRYTVLEIVTTDGQYTWLSSDNNGGRCYLTLVAMDNRTTDIMVLVEYMDSAWYYVCSRMSVNTMDTLRDY